LAKPPQELPENVPAPRGAPSAGGTGLHPGLCPRRGIGGRLLDPHARPLRLVLRLREQQIDALRAELEALRQQAPAAPPARHGRELR
jgi:hypothetical protein